MGTSNTPQTTGAAITAQTIRRGELQARDCPSREVFKHVTSLWAVIALIALHEHGTLRFSDLRRKAAGVSEKMLAQTLKALESDGFINRVSHPVVPPHVEYSLTPLGHEVASQVGGLAFWLEENLYRVMQARRERGSRSPDAR